nr:STAS domain-containing protein [Clostridium oryzae]
MENVIAIPDNFAVEEAAEYRKKIYKLIEDGERSFIFDFSKCNFIDSTGLGVLVGIYKRCNEANGKFTIRHINNPQVLKVFQLTRLDKVFNII